MRRLFRLALIAGLLASGASVARRRTHRRSQLNVGHLAEGDGPVIDGVDEASWASTSRSARSFQQEPDEGSRPPSGPKSGSSSINRTCISASSTSTRT